MLMKKINHGILLLFAAGSLFSCKNSKTADKEIKGPGYNPFREDFPGDVKELTETTYKPWGDNDELQMYSREYSLCDQKGNRLVWATWGGEGEGGETDTTTGRRTTYQYDADGKWIGDSTFGADGEFLEYSTMTYDEKNTRCEIKRFNAGKELTLRSVLTLDDKGQQTEELAYFTGDTAAMKNVSVYDNSGHIIEFITYNGKGERTERYTYKYDNNGKNIEQNFFSIDGKLYSHVAVTNDANGNEIRSVSSTPENDSLVTITRYENVADKNGNWLKKSVYTGDNKTADKVIERKFVYY